MKAPLSQISLPFSNLTTSLDAANSMVPYLARLESLVHNTIRRAGERGLCDHEGEAITGLLHQTYSSRRRSLVLRGLVRESEVRRRTPHGRNAIAWVAS